MCSKFGLKDGKEGSGRSDLMTINYEDTETGTSKESDFR